MQEKTSREKNQESEMQLFFTCVSCSKLTATTLGKIIWHYDKGNIVPCRCDNCVAEKKRNHQEIKKEEERRG